MSAKIIGRKERIICYNNNEDGSMSRTKGRGNRTLFIALPFFVSAIFSDLLHYGIIQMLIWRTLVLGITIAWSESRHYRRFLFLVQVLNTCSCGGSQMVTKRIFPIKILCEV